jgi:hypothetical protein
MNGRLRVVQKLFEMLKLKGASILVEWDQKLGASYEHGDGLLLCFYLLEVSKKVFENLQTLFLYNFGHFPRPICLEILVRVPL